MTVLLIIGLMSSAVILTLPEDKPEIESFAETLVGDLNSAAQESLLSGRPTGLGLSEDTYAILSFNDGEWQTVKELDWPERAYAKFSKDEVNIDLPEDLTPVAIFEPIGQATVFKLTVEKDNNAFQLESKGDGRVTLGVGS